MNGNSTAFPVPGYEGDSGLTKRELFAAMMMQGILADANDCSSDTVIAVAAVKIADALIAELSKAQVK